jgi:hypothetical protein
MERKVGRVNPPVATAGEHDGESGGLRPACVRGKEWPGSFYT